MKNFCYWQEDAPFPIPSYNDKKICLLREMEFKLIKESQEAGLINHEKISIFCPYINAEQANELCMECKVSNYGKVSE